MKKRTSRRPQRPPGDTRAEVLAYVKAFRAEHSYPPTIKQICKALGILSTGTVHHHLKKLEEDGHLTRPPRTMRAVVLTEPAIAATSDESLTIQLLRLERDELKAEVEVWRAIARAHGWVLESAQICALSGPKKS